MHHPPMKLADMYFWKVAAELLQVRQVKSPTSTTDPDSTARGACGGRSFCSRQEQAALEDGPYLYAFGLAISPERQAPQRPISGARRGPSARTGR